MGTRSGSSARGDFDQVAETRRQIKELSDAWTRRHRLPRGTPEWEKALETEELLVTRVWRRLRRR